MASYYISGIGNDTTGAGTIVSPWASLTKVQGVAVQGDTLNAAGGYTYSPAAAGWTVGITIQSYGTGQATITGPNTAATILFTACNNVTISNLIVTNASVSTYACIQLDPASASNQSGFTVQNCTTINGDYGIYCRGSNGAGLYSNIRLLNNNITNFASRGIWCENTVGLMSDIQANGNTVSVPFNTAPNGGLVIEFCNSSVAPCYIKNNVVSGVIGIGIMVYYTTGVTISGNICHDIYQTATNFDGDGIDIDIGNVGATMIGNIVYNCQGAGLFYYGSTDTSTPSIIAFNLAVKCATISTYLAGMSLYATGECYAYNNTVVQNTGTNPALNFPSGTANKKVYNNILITPSSVATVNMPTITTPFDLQGNAYLSGTSSFLCVYNGTNETSLANWRTATGMESSGHGFALSSAPFLNSGAFGSPTAIGAAQAYGLPSGSALLGAGLNVNTLASITPPATDLVGNPVTASTLSVGAINAALTYTLSGPSTGTDGVPASFALAASSTVVDSITLSDGGHGGTFSPVSPMAVSGTSFSFTYVNATAGTYSLTLTSALGTTITGSPFSITFSAATIATAAMVSKNGVLTFLANGTSGQSNGNWPQAWMQTVPSNPTFKVNGTSIAVNGPAWFNGSAAWAIGTGGYGYGGIHYLPLCGSVLSIPMSNPGTITGALSASASGGGGTGLVLGTVNTAVGVVATILSAGSGLQNGVFDWTGGNFDSNNGFPLYPTGIPASFSITVAGGIVTAITHRHGGPHSWGGGYTLGTPYTVTGVLPAGVGTGGTGASITLTPTTYITGVTVTNGGSGYTSQPTITITGATGATCAPIMSGPLSTDVVTYSASAGWYTTNLGSAPAATGAVMVNSVGSLEPAIANWNGYQQTPSMAYGAFPTTIGSIYYAIFCSFANKFLTNNSWQLAGSALTNVNVFGYPTTWTPGATIYADISLYPISTGPSLVTIPAGIWTLVYENTNIPDGTITAAWTGDFSVIGSPTTTVSGTTVTTTYNVQNNSSTSGMDMSIRVSATSTLGSWHFGTNVGVFPPGTAIDRSPWAIDDNWVTALTGMLGTVTPVMRFMSDIQTSGYPNWCDVSDLPAWGMNSYFIWHSLNLSLSSPAPNSTTGVQSGTIACTYVRFLNTNPASGTYAWSSPHLYSSAPWACSGSDAFGTYLDMTAGPHGANDNGQIFTPAGYSSTGRGVCEFVTATPHGLKTGQYIGFCGTAAIPWNNGNGTQNFPGSSTGGPGLGFNGTWYLVMVTSATSFFVSITGLSGVNSGVNSTSQVPLTGFTVSVQNTYGSSTFPYEFQARYVARFPGSYHWVNFPPTASHALITEIVNRVCTYLGPTNGFVGEFGNEHWNTNVTGTNYWASTTYNFSQYAPSGQPYLTYGTGGALITNPYNAYPTGINTLQSADARAIALAAWTANGRSASSFYWTYGSQYTAQAVTAAQTYTFSQLSIPTTNSFQTIAPYLTAGPAGGNVNSGVDTALSTCFAPAGDAVIASAGNWPVSAICDVTRFRLTTSNYDLAQFTIHKNALASGCGIAFYEGVVNGYFDPTNLGPTGRYLQQDIESHPAQYDIIWCYGLMMQNGNPITANSGAKFMTVSGMWLRFGGPAGQQYPFANATIGIGTSTVEGLHVNGSPYSPNNRGLTNKFFTPQGGAAGADASHPIGYPQVNGNPGIQAMIDFNAIAPMLPQGSVSSSGALSNSAAFFLFS